MADKVTQVYGGRAYITFRENKHLYTVSVPEQKIYDLWQPSVTGIIGMKDKSGALVNWAVDCMYKRTKSMLDLVPDPLEREAVMAVVDSAKGTWREVRDESASIGSLVHRVLEQELNARGGLCEHPKLPLKPDAVMCPDLTPDMLDKANAAIEAGFEFFNQHHIEVIEAEGIRWSPKYGYLGTGDLIAKVDGDLTVLDYKTGKRLYSTVFLQLAAYQIAYEEEHPDTKILKRLAVNVSREGKLETSERDNSTLKEDFQAFLGLLRIWRWECSNSDWKAKNPPRIIGSLN